MLKKKAIGPSGPLGATTVNKDKKKEGDINFAFESARTAVRTELSAVKSLARVAPAETCLSMVGPDNRARQSSACQSG